MAYDQILPQGSQQAVKGGGVGVGPEVGRDYTPG